MPTKKTKTKKTKTTRFVHHELKLSKALQTYLERGLPHRWDLSIQLRIYVGKEGWTAEIWDECQAWPRWLTGEGPTPAAAFRHLEARLAAGEVPSGDRDSDPPPEPNTAEISLEKMGFRPKL